MFVVFLGLCAVVIFVVVAPQHPTAVQLKAKLPGPLQALAAELSGEASGESKTVKEKDMKMNVSNPMLDMMGSDEDSDEEKPEMPNASDDEGGDDDDGDDDDDDDGER